MEVCIGRTNSATECMYADECGVKVDCTTSEDMEKAINPVYVACMGKCMRDEADMDKNDIEWLEKCKDEPDKYRVDVDNDYIFVTDLEQEDDVHTFSAHGYEFALELLRYIGCNAEMV